METLNITPVHKLFGIHKGVTNNEGQKVVSLYSTHWEFNGQIEEKKEPDHIKDFYYSEGIDQYPAAQIEQEIILNNWERFNKDLTEGQKVEISEHIYYHFLNCLPPRNWNGKYFEVGEPHHHDNKGRAIHRACWIEDGKFFTGYPKMKD